MKKGKQKCNTRRMFYRNTSIPNIVIEGNGPAIRNKRTTAHVKIMWPEVVCTKVQSSPE